MSDLLVNVEAVDEVGELAPAVEAAAKAALRHQGVDRGELTVMLASDERLQQLNQEFLGRNRPTDVLSFPADDSNPETGLPYLGDIAISLAAVARQAADAGHSQRAELMLLTVHGVLHLLGHDDRQPQERARMESAQRQVLSGLLDSAELSEGR